MTRGLRGVNAFDAGTNRIRFSGWVTAASGWSIEAYASAGFDYVTIDCQHGLLDETGAAEILCRLPANSAMVRVSANRAELIGKVLDAGAAGVIIPTVEDAEQAAAAVAACHYPPDGIRSFALLRDDLGSTPSEISSGAACFPMVETARGLANVEEICAVPGVSGIYVGPADLSISLGLPLPEAFSTDRLRGQFGRIRSACERHGLSLGAHALDPAGALRWAGYGCTYISVGSDVALLNQAAHGLIAELRGQGDEAATE